MRKPGIDMARSTARKHSSSLPRRGNGPPKSAVRRRAGGPITVDTKAEEPRRARPSPFEDAMLVAIGGGLLLLPIPVLADYGGASMMRLALLMGLLAPPIVGLLLLDRHLRDRNSAGRDRGQADAGRSRVSQLR